jgi:ABC-type bacteriocin/lantibiotic exporter with double-glycine peptidase domain
MSVAKALIEDINAIKVERGLLESINAFKRLIKYYKPYIHFLIIIVVFSILRSYLFTLEPLYTSQIIDVVII